MTYVDNQEITVDGKVYQYSEFYERFTLKDFDYKNPVFPDILCGKCLNDSFHISYGDYECLAKCTKCGKVFVVYDG